MGLRDRAKSTLRALRAQEGVPQERHANSIAPSKPAPLKKSVERGRFSEIAAKAAAGELGKALYADDASTGIEAYAARMKANGRNVELAGEGMNQNKEGIQFWGPIDNSSSQSKAVGEVLTIDQWECITCGTCEENTKVVFQVPDDEKAQVLQQNGPMDLIQDAIDACPVTCISWISPDLVDEQHSHGGYKKED